MDTYLQILLVAVLLLGVILVEELPRLARRKRSIPFRAFAAANAMKYRFHGRSPSLRAALFGLRLSGGNDVANVIDGAYKGHGIKLFTYKDKYTVVQAIMHVVAPHILLKAVAANIDTAIMWKINPNKLVQVKDYGSMGIELYATSGYEIEALEIFTPDVIERIADEKGIYCVDIFNGKVFVYDNRVMRSREEITHLLDTTIYFLNKKKGEIEELQDDFAGLGPYFRR